MSVKIRQLPSTTVKALEEFIRKRWVRIGGRTIEGLAEMVGMSKQTFYNLLRSPNPWVAGRLETRETIALHLRFKDWDQLRDAFEDDDVLHGLPVVTLSATAFDLARAAADREERTVDQWVSDRVIEWASSSGSGKSK